VKDLLKILLAISLFFGGLMLYCFIIAKCAEWRDARDRQLVRIRIGEWKPYCGPQKWVHYGISSVRVEYANGWQTYYGPMVIDSVDSCVEKPN
jgi:hypothetical protein